MTKWKPPSTVNRSVGILGAGVLGRRVGACWASAGFNVHIRDPDPQQTNGALQFIKNELWRYKPAISADKVSVKGFQDLKSAVQDSWLVIECVPEKLELKQKTFAELEQVVRPDAILASNSSSYKSREIAAKVKPETAARMLNTHYYIPPDIRVVEFMTSGTTHQEIFPFLLEQFKASGMLPVVAHQESTGFILNRVWAAIKRECLMVLAEGVASPEELDSVWTEMFIKNAVPPCELMDSVGLDTVSLIEQHYIRERNLEDRGVLPYLQKFIDEGKLGAKCSKGGLYPPGHSTKTAGEEQNPYDNIHAPSLYILDLGLNNDPEVVYQRGRILVGSADGKTPLRTIVERQPMPDGIAICPSNGKLIWGNMGVPNKNDGSIMTCNLDGSDIKTIIAPGMVHTPKQIAVDDDCSKIYFSDREGLRVFRCNVDGSGLETLIRNGDWTLGFQDHTQWCVGIALAPQEGKFYWTQKGPSKGQKGRIFRANIITPPGHDASTRADIECLFDGLPEPIDLEIDEEGKAMYWTDRGELPDGNSLNRAEMGPDGKYRNHKILARNLHEGIGLALDKKNRHIYATDLGGAVYRFNMDGGERKKFYEDEGSFAGIALCDSGPSMMSFAIEVPGEAAPLSLFELGKALELAAVSQHNAQGQSASQQLQAWESHQDYYVSLQTIFLDKSLRKEVRFLAIILLKNGIDRYWRHTAKHAIKPPEKYLIRSRLLEGSIDEEDKTFSLHNALVTAKIVRIDYPDEWPDVMLNLITIMRTSKNGNPVHLGGSLLVLLRIVKEMGTARLRRSQTALQAVTPELVQLLGEIYTEKTAYWQEFLMKGRGDEDDADYAMENSLLALKILRRLVTVGYQQPHADSMVQGFWSLSQTQFDQFLNGVSHDSWIPIPYQDTVGKHLVQFTKLHIEMSEQHPASFPLLPNSLDLVRAYWNLVKEFSHVFEKSGGLKQASSETGNIKHEGPLSEKLALKGLLLLRSCMAIAYRHVQTFRYRSADTKELEKQAVHVIKVDLLKRDLLLDIVQVIISKLFIFRKSDLEAWEENPEDWESQERTEGDAYQWAIRPCAERLLIDLLTNYRELGQPLLSYCELATKVDMDIVTREAAYCALGCAAAIIQQAFDFDRFLTTTLVKDAQIQDSMAKLLRRRIAILLSQWISIKISAENRAVVYDIFRHLLNPNDNHNDEVVRITAARQFKFIVEDFGFNGEVFLPYAADIFNLLINLLQEVENDEAKLAILETVRHIVERMDQHISQFGDAIMLTLPKLWESAASEEYMIKQSVLAIMAALVMSMRADSQRYQHAIIPLLAEAMNPESPLHLHLIEESVELWKSLLLQSVPPLNPDLTQMVPLALPMLEYDTEVANQCLEIVKGYILLTPQEVLSDNLRRPTLQAVAQTLDSKSRDQSEVGAKCMELIIRLSEELGGVQGVTVVVQDLVELGVLRTILEGLHSSWEASQTSGPNRKQSSISTIKETDYFAILARITVADPSILANVLGHFGGVENVWPWLSAQWFANFDNMGDVEREKLSCLALTRVMELPSPVQELVLDKLQDYLSMWTSVVMELVDGTETPHVGGCPQPDSLVWSGEISRYDYDTPLDLHERSFAAKDPVHTAVTYEFVMARLQGLVARVGGEQAFEAQWALNVDRDVLVGFQKLSVPWTGNAE
ncbi:armadillo-type protein [Cladorrhinum sp. PSN332]|nr:armadillo-type protein [Cladorrhinum sp. PSN332]